MSSKPSSDFGVKKFDHPIIDIAPGNTIRTGVDYHRQFRGLVPFFEEYDAMISAGYNANEWENLDPIERADAVAYYRLQKLVSLHENDAVQKHMERQRKRKR